MGGWVDGWMDGWTNEGNERQDEKPEKRETKATRGSVQEGMGRADGSLFFLFFFLFFPSPFECSAAAKGGVFIVQPASSGEGPWRKRFDPRQCGPRRHGGMGARAAGWPTSRIGCAMAWHGSQRRGQQLVRGKYWHSGGLILGRTRTGPLT